MEKPLEKLKIIMTSPTPDVLDHSLLSPKHRRFASWMMNRRKAIGLKRQSDLAAKSGIALSTINRWEQGDISGAHVEKLEKLAEALEVPFEHLNMVRMQSQEEFNLERETYLGLNECGLAEDQLISLTVTLCEMTRTFASYDDIRTNLSLEFEMFKSAASMLASKMRQLPRGNLDRIPTNLLHEIPGI